jgi:hypothetical protein
MRCLGLRSAILSHVIHSMHSLQELKLQLMILQFSHREPINNELDVIL